MSQAHHQPTLFRALNSQPRPLVLMEVDTLSLTQELLLSLFLLQILQHSQLPHKEEWVGFLVPHSLFQEPL